MSGGNKQFEMEGESVARHYGRIKQTIDSKKPLYCLFIAPKISDGALAHFFNLNRLSTKAYGGKTQIIPMNLETFLNLLQIGVDKSFDRQEHLEKLLEKSIELNRIADDEFLWLSGTTEFVRQWV